MNKKGIRNLDLRMNKKGTASIAIVILVIATMILFVFALYTFNIRSKSAKDLVLYSDNIMDVYGTNELISFSVYEIMGQIDKPTGKDDFIAKFNAILDKYAPLPYNLVSVKNQLKPENVEISSDGKKLTFKIELVTSTRINSGNSEAFSVSYNFVKEYVMDYDLAIAGGSSGTGDNPAVGIGVSSIG